ncbi:cadherin-related family member 4 [Gastrophryne carolinensis]
MAWPSPEPDSAEFLDLPATVPVLESSAIGTSVYNFSLVNCSSSNPTVIISSVSPPATYFNTPAQSRTATSEYALEITLSSTAALNAEVVNAYTLEITATCGSSTVTGKLFINIINDLPEPQCEPKFASQVGDTVRVYSNLPSSSPVYVVVLRQPKYLPVTFRITSPSPSPFTISSSGTVSSPTAGFTNTNKLYTLEISVTDSRGNTCNGTLRVEVLPVYENPINFTSSSFNFTIPENGNALYLVGMLAASGNNLVYEMITPSTNYYIEPGTGALRTTYNLDLETNPALVRSVLQVRVYDRYQRTNSATATVTIIVTDVNDIAPSCSPAIVVTEVPETQPVGSVLARFTCTDPDYNSTSITYTVVPNTNSLYSFRVLNNELLVSTIHPLCSLDLFTTLDPLTLLGSNELVDLIISVFCPTFLTGMSAEFLCIIDPKMRQMENDDDNINSTLDYDSYAIASMNSQYTTTIKVTDSGTPQMTTYIPVFVTVTPVNEYPPNCVGPYNFSVSENALFGTSVGTVNATDADYPFNNVKFSITSGPTNPPIFYIMPRTGMIILLGPLDYETVTSYSLTIQVVDLNNDIIPDPAAQKTTTCPITINVQDYNDEPPVCTPPFYHETIYSTDPAPVVTLTCKDTDGTQRALYYRIVGGNTNNRFTMNSPTLMHNTFSYNPDGVYDPVKYELLVEVTDSLTTPQYTTTAMVFVTVVPWTTAQPTTTSTTTTSEPQTKIVTQMQQYWKPDVWFMVVLTITAALLLSAIGLLTWYLCRRSPICGQGTKEAMEPLLQERSLQNPEQATNPNPSKEKKDLAPVSPLSLQFDGRAQDPLTGREYLFNSLTGERRWI